MRPRAVDPPASKQGLRSRGRQILQQMLDRTRWLRQRAAALQLPAVGLAQEAWLTGVAVGADTRRTIGWEATDDGPRFKLQDAKPNAGDGTVPIEGATPPPCLARESVAAVSPSELELFELKDKLMLKAAGFRAELPT